jgi:hypothetical protein
MQTARLFGVGVNIDRDDVVNFGQLQFGHAGFPMAD